MIVLDGGDRAAGVFGVHATGFSVLLGLIVSLAFASPGRLLRVIDDALGAVAAEAEVPCDVAGGAVAS